MQYLPIPFTALDKSADKPGQSTWHQGQFDGYWQRHNTADGPRFLWTKRPGLTEFCNLGESAKVNGLHYWTRQDVLAASCNGKMFVSDRNRHQDRHYRHGIDDRRQPGHICRRIRL
jgi:hypothetical protein